MISASAELSLIKQIQAGDESAFTKLLKAHEHFLWRLARAYTYRGNSGRPGLEFDDAMQIVALAAHKALRKFDAGAGFRFLTFMTRQAKWDLSHARINNSLIRVRAMDSEATRADAAKIKTPKSLDAPLPGFSELTLGATFSDDTNVISDVVRREQVEMILASIKRLPQKWQYILRCRLDGQTFQEISGVLGVTKERVRQIEKEAKGRIAELCGNASAK